MTIYKRFILCIFFVTCFTAAALCANIDFTVNTDGAVVVTGSPRLTLTVGSATKYAVYNAGASTGTALVFRYAVTAGDFDADGIAAASPIDLNSGTIRDAAGNNLVLTYTAPNTTGVKVQTYQVAFTTDPITPANETAAAFQMTKAPVGATFDYSISSSGGGAPVTGSGTIATATQNVTGINVSALPPGTLTVSLTMTDASGTGLARTDTVTTAAAALDSLTAEAAYSTRRLRTAYTGPLMRVRRSSDNAEQDIGSTYAGELNTTALAAFCGADSCFVRTWHDQSGNTRHVNQANGSEQARIVNAGTIDTKGGKPAPLFISGSGTFYTNATPTQNIMGNTPAFMAVVSPNFYSQYMAVLYWRGASEQGLLASAHNTWSYMWNGTASTWDWSGGPVFTAGSLQTIGVQINAGAGTFYKNGTEVTNTTAHNAAAGTSVFTIAKDPCCGRFFDGHMPEIAVFSSISNGSRQTYEAGQRAYFSIP
jgi:hypothetical protein